jgi:hypothetical protein
VEGESYQALRLFFERAAVARVACRPLAREARVNVALPEGTARFTMEAGVPALLAGADPDPDFTLRLPAGAVRRITTMESDDVGELGIAFFQLVLERDPELHVRVHLEAPAARLLARGYLGVLARGGLKVTWWLLRNGVKNPAAALERFRKRP